MDKGENKRNFSHPKGRPSLQRQQVIKEDCRKFFDDGYSANYCHTETGYKQETIYAYFKEWTEELIDKTDFVSQQQATKVRLAASLDKSIRTFNDQRDFLVSKRTNKFNPALENTLAKTNWFLSKLHIEKANVLMLATLDITIPKLLKEKWGIDIEEKPIEQEHPENTRT